MMAELDYDALQRVADAATPGPWQLGSQTHGPNAIVRDAEGLSIIQDVWVCDADASAPENAEFIAASRSAIPALLARVRELERADEEAARLGGVEGLLMEANDWRDIYKAERDAAQSIIAKVRALLDRKSDAGKGFYLNPLTEIEALADLYSDDFAKELLAALGSVPSIGEGNDALD